MYKEAIGSACPPSHVKWLNCPLRKFLQNPIKIVGKYVSQGDTVVDLGCGGGYFTVALADMVGENGRVVAVDLQEEMLTTAREFARKKGVFERIRFHQCAADDLGLTNVKADFILAFYVVHEVPDRERFLRQVVELLKPNGHFLLIEPKHHVREFQFETILVEAKGLEQIKPIKIIASRGMLFKLNANNYNKLQK